VQAVKPAPSRSHSNVADGSVDPNVNVAVALATVPDGPEPIEVSGGDPLVTLTVQMPVAGDGSTFPAPSIASTSKVWAPFARAL
jgi:hypothetical protein